MQNNPVEVWVFSTVKDVFSPWKPARLHCSERQSSCFNRFLSQSQTIVESITAALQYAYQSISCPKVTHAACFGGKLVNDFFQQLIMHRGVQQRSARWAATRVRLTLVLGDVTPGPHWFPLYTRFERGVDSFREGVPWWEVFPYRQQGMLKATWQTFFDFFFCEDILLPERQQVTSTPSSAFHVCERVDKHHTSCLPLHKTTNEE